MRCAGEPAVDRCYAASGRSTRRPIVPSPRPSIPMTTTPAVEHVLVVPTLLFHELGYFQGFTENVRPYVRTLFDPAHTSFRPRDQMESDPSYKQLIPYCIFRCGGL